MSPREQIGLGQLSVLMVGFLLGSTLLLPMGAPAKQAAWIATLLGGAGGLGIAFIYTRLALRFPGQGITGYSRLALGPWAGSLVGLLYIWYGFHLGALVLRNFGEFFLTALLPATPLSVIILTLMLLCAFGVRHGLEPVARSAHVLVPLVLMMAILAVILVAKEARLQHLQPWLGDQPVSILQAALTMMSFPFGETVIFAMVLPRVRPAKAVPGTVFRTMLAVTVLLAVLAALGTAVLGVHIRGTSRFATLAMVRQITLADFVTNLDALLIGAWVFTGYCKVSVCLHFCATGLAEWLGLAAYRQLILPIGILMVGLSILAYPDVSKMTSFLSVWAVYSVPYQILFPLLLLGAAHLRGQPAAQGKAE
ncbi:MAG TPA: endospore germination permease [Symbiobacteriaceae bacterium]|nr:endospore germination permease [Symbiobacteriaceae bacterium]